MLKNCLIKKNKKKNITKFFWTKNHVNMEVPINSIIIVVIIIAVVVIIIMIMTQ